MNNKTIHQIASLIIALVMILGNTVHSQAAVPTVQTESPSIYWGAMVNGKVPSSANLSGVFAAFETRSRKRMSIIHWGQPWIMADGTWGEFQTIYFDNARNNGYIPMINWASQKLGAGINQADFQLSDIYNGTYDTYIRRWATDAKNWGHPFFMYFDPEMNGWWSPWAEGKTSNGTIINGNSPGDYVIAWRHVHDIFTSVGATNVSWVWGPNHMSTSSQYPALSTLYPGDNYVDWTGLSVYNKYQTWAGLNPLLTGSEGMTWFRNSYSELLALAPNKPIMLAQWASIEAGDGGAKKAAWITDALTNQIPNNFPKIKAIVWLNWQETPNETYPIESSQAATDAWAAAISSSLYASNQYANLNTSPIPAPTATTISGNVGVGGVVLSYMDGTLKTVTSQGNGNYSIPVPTNWTGTVTPSNDCYTFSPLALSYINITQSQTLQHYLPIFNGESQCAMNAGLYDDTHPAWVYLGTWANYNGNGAYNKTLHYTFATGDTASFPFNGTQFVLTYTQDTNRSSYEVYVDGNKVTTLNANGSFQWRRNYISPTYTNGTHVVKVQNAGGGGGVMDIDAIRILASAIPGAGTYDDGNSNWAYAGTWALYNSSGPYNNSLHYTLVTGNTASFVFNGTQFILTYTQDTNRSSYEVYVDGSRVTTLNAAGGFQWQRTYTSPFFAAGTHVVEFTNIGGGGNVMDMDAIQILANTSPGVGTYDDGNFNWSYAGSWSTLAINGAYNNTLHYTFQTGDSVSFPFNGTQFILTYTQDTNRGNYDVFVDMNKVATINANGVFQWQKTYTSPVFLSGTHIVELMNAGGGGGIMDVDAIQILESTVPGSGTYDDGSVYWAYAGNWTLYSNSGPYNNSLHYTSTVGNSASFTFSGIQFILTYTQDTNRGNYDVFVDMNKVATINANGVFQWQKKYISPSYANGTHTVRFVHAGGNPYMDIDAIQIIP